MYQRYFKVEGDSFTRGEAIGSLLKSRIATNIINLHNFFEHKTITFDSWIEKSSEYIPFIKEYAPDTFRELEGMAKGSGFSLKEIVALNTEYELAFISENISDKCSSFAATKSVSKNGEVICAQSNDESLSEWLHHMDVVLHHKDGDLETLIYTHPGISAYMGMNNKGIAILWTYIDNGYHDLGLPTNALIREVLNKKSFDEVSDFIKSVPHSLPNQYIIASSSDEIVSFECFGDRKVVEHRDDKFIAHTNHTLFCDTEKELSTSFSSHKRLDRLNELINENFGQLTTEKAKEFYKDHKYFPYSLCVHPNEHKPMGKTLASMVFNVTKKEMHIAFGNPCEMEYNLYKFDNN